MYRQIVGVAISAAAVLFSTCSKERPLYPVPAPEPLIHELWEDAEAEVIACMISGKLSAPRELYDRVIADLAIIREVWMDSIPVVTEIKADSWLYQPGIRLNVESDVMESMRQGSYHDWDSINSLIKPEIAVRQYDVTIQVSTRVNIWRLLQSYERLRGVQSLWPERGSSDRPKLYAHMIDNDIGYLFRDAWGDCMLGCITSHFYYFRSDSTGIRYVGNWLRDWPRTPEPEWWIIARDAETLWKEGDAEYRFRDATAPGRVVDLKQHSPQFGGFATLTFTAPGDLGLTGNASGHVFRWSRDSVTEANWYQLPQLTVPARPVGTIALVPLNKLHTQGKNIIAMRSVDEFGNVSAVSNQVTTENLLQFGWTIYNSSNSPLPGNEITAVFVDSRNQTWVGTTLGLAVLSAIGGRSFTSVDHPVLAEDVVAIAEDHAGDILFGTYSGAARFDGDSWSSVWPIPNSPSESEVRCIAIDDDGAIWMGIGFSGAVRLDGGQAQFFNSSNSGIRGSIIRRIAKSPDGSLWFAGSDGLSRYHNGTWSSHGPKLTVMSLLVQSPDTIAFGSYDGTLHRAVGGEHWDAIKLPPYESFPREPGAPSDIVIGDDGSLWLTSYGSLRRYEPDSLPELLRVLPSNSGLPERKLTSLAVGNNNSLWIGTRNWGVCHWNLAEAGMPATPPSGVNP